MTPPPANDGAPATRAASDTCAADDALASFSDATRHWFRANFPAPTRIQRLGWPAIASREHALLIAPTGSGKTLAAFLVAIDRLLRERLSPPETTATAANGHARRRGWRVVYLSPLKALAADVERNLRAPLVGVTQHLARQGQHLREIRVDLRTGDTPTRERARQARDPGDILVTTPESLFLLLASKAAERLRHVDTLIVDEVHALAGTKRGAHLALTLERLAALQADHPEDGPQRIGLSATVAPASTAARWLGGTRDVRICDAAEPPRLDLAVLLPEELDEAPEEPHDESPGPPAATPTLPLRSGSILGQLYADAVSGALAGDGPRRPRDRAAALERRLLPLILAHRSTIVFVNSRGLCERLVQRLNQAYAEHCAAQHDAAEGDITPQSAASPTPDAPIPELCAAHHGSVSHARRAELEERLKAGQIRALVATSSLELGVDMGGVDLVVLVESPGAVSRGLQRAGRAGHGVGQTSIARIVPRHRYELVECAVLGAEMLAGRIEPLALPRAPLDVLAQQIVAIVCAQPDGASVAEVERLVRRAAPYTELAEGAFHAVLDLLSGHYPSTELAHLRPWLAWDRAEDRLTPRRGARLAVRLNAGTIPDRGQYRVQLGDSGPRIGELDEEMVYELRVGEIVTLGASSWRVEDITHDAVRVSPAPGLPGKLPFWRGDGPGRPLGLSLRMLELLGELEPLSEADRLRYLLAETPLAPPAARELVRLVAEQIERAGVLPTPRRIVIERFRDELGDWRVCLHAPFGTPVLTPWALALQHRLAEDTGYTVQVLYTDDGIMLRLADADAPLDLSLLLPDAADLERVVTEQLAQSSVFAARFRENAARALLLARNRPDRRTPLWAQRIQSAQLLAAVQRYPSFPIVLETYRELLADVFDLAGLRRILDDIARGQIDVVEVETPRASPFARALAFAFVAAYVYEGDLPLAERRAQALTLDRELLAELIGHTDLRELLDLAVIEALEAELGGLTPETAPRSADELHDWLRRIGDRSDAELDALADVLAKAPAAADDSGDATDRRSPDGGANPGHPSNGAPAPGEIDPARGHRQARAVLDGWLGALEHSRRAARVAIAGEPRWIAADDAGLYRDALGLVPPPGLPDRFLAPRDAPLEQLLARFAATRGPFELTAFARRYDLPLPLVDHAAQALVRGGRLTQGALRPGGSGVDFCHVEILRRVKRRTLAAARREVAAVDAATYQRFLLEWQGLTPTRGERHRPRLEDVLLQLEGFVAPWSVWRDVIFPARVPGFRMDALELLIARGEWLWIGHGALGPGDARVCFVRRETLALLPLPDTGELDASERALLAAVERLGAAYHMDLIDAWHSLDDVQQDADPTPSAAPTPDRSTPHPLTSDALDAALGRLLWSGHLVNDTLGPLRSLGRPRTRRPGRRQTTLPRDGAATRVTPFAVAGRDTGFGRLRLGRQRTRLGARSGGSGLAGGRYSSRARDALRWRRELAPEADDRSALQTERALLWLDQLLERYGVVCRAVVQAEGLDGGFGALYPLLRQLEEQGQLRRGHFVEGLNGVQFARRHAVDRLRALERDPAGAALAAHDAADPWRPSDNDPWRDRPAGTHVPPGADADAIAPPVQWLAALDPAQPWGRLLRWPDRDGTAPDDEDDDPRRHAPPPDAARKRPAGARLIPGAWIGLIDGQPVLWASPAGRRFECIGQRRPDGSLYSDDDWVALWRAFARVATQTGTRRAIVFERADDRPLRETAWPARLIAAGAEATPAGVVFHPADAGRP